MKRNYSIREYQSNLGEDVSKLVGDTKREREIPSITEIAISRYFPASKKVKLD